MGVYGEGLYGAGYYGIVITMAYNEKREELYIRVGEADTRIFNKFGMFSISADIGDAVKHSGKQMVHSPTVISQTEISFSSDIINFNTQGIKALEWLNLNIDCPDPVYVTVRYRDSTQDAWASAPQKQFNAEGVCHIGVRGIEFILDFSIPAFTTLFFSLMEIGVQFVDRRFRRGVSV